VGALSCETPLSDGGYSLIACLLPIRITHRPARLGFANQRKFLVITALGMTEYSPRPVDSGLRSLGMTERYFFRMEKFFTRDRFGEPQFIAGVLLLAFLAQCSWLVAVDMRSGSVSTAELFHIRRGLRQWRGAGSQRVELVAGIAGDPHAPAEVIRNDGWDPNHSPLYYLISAAPLLLWPRTLNVQSESYWGWLARAPWLLFGVMLGASLWYVARRLYGNAGGYIALTLYCFSPAVIRESAAWFREPETGAAWGAFGAIFTAIAVAHTLYAPREVVLWNWRRILLLGVSLALAIGMQFSLILLVPVALGFLLYVAPTRRKAAVVIWAAACAIAAFILLASYYFRLPAFWSGMRHAEFFGVMGQAYVMRGAYGQLLDQLSQGCPALVFAFPAALIAFLAWRRARYFGNTAPLLMVVLLLAFGLGMPHYPGLGFRFIALPFLFLFIAGVFADLLETRRRAVVLASVCGLLASYAVWTLMELARVRM